MFSLLANFITNKFNLNVTGGNYVFLQYKTNKFRLVLNFNQLNLC